MTILDDARELLDSEPTYDIASDHINRCHYCDAPRHDQARQPLGEHQADCPWLLLPKIVAVLAAAEKVAQAYDEETVATGIGLLGSPLLAAVDALARALEG